MLEFIDGDGSVIAEGTVRSEEVIVSDEEGGKDNGTVEGIEAAS